MMLDPFNADELRQWAKLCAEKAERAAWSPPERDRLIAMKDSLLALADNADWLAGRSHDVAFQNAAE